MSIAPSSRSQFQPGGSPRVSFEVFPARSTMQSDGMSELARVMGRYQPEFVSVTTVPAAAAARRHSVRSASCSAMAGFRWSDTSPALASHRRRPTP
jgi:5,10-methylenetetrahydrofolate reductase